MKLGIVWVALWALCFGPSNCRSVIKRARASDCSLTHTRGNNLWRKRALCVLFSPKTPNGCIVLHYRFIWPSSSGCAVPKPGQAPTLGIAETCEHVYGPAQKSRKVCTATDLNQRGALKWKTSAHQPPVAGNYRCKWSRKFANESSTETVT